MAKKTPRDYDTIGDPSRTEGAAGGIYAAGRGTSFKAPDEKFTGMHARRSAVTPKSENEDWTKSVPKNPNPPTNPPKESIPKSKTIEKQSPDMDKIK